MLILYVLRLFLAVGGNTNPLALRPSNLAGKKKCRKGNWAAKNYNYVVRGNEPPH